MTEHSLTPLMTKSADALSEAAALASLFAEVNNGG
jgi:hypothetical protein